jgi:hypothetical protein
MTPNNPTTARPKYFKNTGLLFRRFALKRKPELQNCDKAGYQSIVITQN